MGSRSTLAEPKGFAHRLDSRNERSQGFTSISSFGGNNKLYKGYKKEKRN